MFTIGTIHFDGLKQARQTLLGSALLLAPMLSMAQFSVTTQGGALTAFAGDQVSYAGGGGDSRADQKTTRLANITSGSQNIAASAQVTAPFDERFVTLPTTANLSTGAAADDISIGLNASILSSYSAGSLLNGWQTNGSGGITADVYLSFDVSAPTDVLLAFDHASFANAAGFDSLSEDVRLNLYKLNVGQPNNNRQSVWSHQWSAGSGLAGTQAPPADKASLQTLDQGRYELAFQYHGGGRATSYSAILQARALSFHISAVPETSTLTMWAMGGLLMALARRGRASKRA
jgi:hypothetical protein